MEDPMADDKAAPDKATTDAPDDETFAKFKECAVEVLHVAPEKVTPDASFAEDLDADSLDLVELVMALEEQFGITVDEAELEGVATVRQAFDLVSSKL
jgi:acyl carrier protein